MSVSKNKNSDWIATELDAIRCISKKVEFGKVRVFYFQRIEANIDNTRPEGYFLSMTRRHFRSQFFGFAYAKTRECKNVLIKYTPQQRYQKLQAAGCKIWEEEPTKLHALDGVLIGRGICGCLCEKICNPTTCPCAIEGLDCIVDEALTKCQCFGTPECSHYQICGSNNPYDYPHAWFHFA